MVCSPQGEHATSLMMSFRLNEENVIQEVIESIPVDSGESDTDSMLVISSDLLGQVFLFVRF